MKNLRLDVLSAMAVAFLSFVGQAESEVITVKGKGVGISETAALKDAYRDAIETAVGLYVDAEQMVKNDEVIKDEILTQSNAYIEGYDVISKKTADDVVVMKILAKVRTKSLTTKVATFMTPKKIESGSFLQSYFAQDVTKREAGEAGAAILQKALKDFDPIKSLLEIELLTKDPVLINPRDTDNQVRAAYLFRRTFSNERYFNEVVPRLRGVLSQVSISEPKGVTISVTRQGKFDVKSCYCNGKVVSVVDGDTYLYNKDSSIDLKCVEYGRMSGVGGSIKFGQNEDATQKVVLITSMNKIGTVYKGDIYELDKYSAKVLNDWNRTCVLGMENPILKVDFVDAEGESLECKDCCACERQYATPAMMRHFDGSHENVYTIAPFMGIMAFGMRSYTAMESSYFWAKFQLSKDALPSLKGIKFELVK